MRGDCGVVLEGSAANGAAPPLPASHPQACAAAVDELVGQMKAANIAFNGRKETDTIQVSETMTTHLKSKI